MTKSIYISQSDLKPMLLNSGTLAETLERLTLHDCLASFSALACINLTFCILLQQTTLATAHPPCEISLSMT